MDVDEGTELISHLGSWLWAGLAAYVLAVDVYALTTKRETLSEALARGLRHPSKKWFPILAWGITTKHLFFRRYVPWADPYGLIALGVTTASNMKGKRNVHIGS